MTTPILLSELTSNYGWNAVAGRYVNLLTGRFVPFATVRDALESLIDVSALRIDNVTRQLIDGRISLAEWQSSMMEQIRLGHIASAAAARGGWAQMSQADWGAAGRWIRDQYEFLRNFAQEIADEKQRLNGSAAVRAGLYAQAFRGTFEEMRRRYERLMNGAVEERRDLGAADHCPGCLEQARLGWQPLGLLAPIGSQQCVTNCHCRFRFRSHGPAGEWIVSESDE
jgi:hypothetical protein